MGLLSVLMSFLMLVFVNPSSLENQEDCWIGGQYYFVINQIAESDAPDSIRVYFEDGMEDDAMVVDKNENMAHYRYGAVDGVLVNASANVPENWDGQFNLSCTIPTGIGLVDFKASPSVDEMSYVVTFGGIAIALFLAAITVWVREL